ncbi:uncharacterized protein LOC134221110 isoform X2 [Armigeres subalbatus]|uniref:uncharacterized protein LOC134221110 isoform X2 n=1 Tax=Armigeres subalbatus TaxID=124917 RepID=UPI002ED68714
MGKTRKNTQRKHLQKAANAENIKFLENQPAEQNAEPSDTERRIQRKPLIEAMDLTVQTPVLKGVFVKLHRALGNQEVKQFPVEEGGDAEAEDPTTQAQVSLVDGDHVQDLHIDCSKKIVTMEEKMTKLISENKDLKEDVEKLRKQNWQLQCKLVEESGKITTFETKIRPGYPSPEWLLKASQIAKDSDYIFVKELMAFLWPKGVGHGTVTGRTSNNPCGGKRTTVATNEPTAGPSSSSTTPENFIAIADDSSAQLDPDKIKFIKESLCQRRQILGDGYGLAMDLSKKAVQHINRVLSNNPAMRSMNK